MQRLLTDSWAPSHAIFYDTLFWAPVWALCIPLRDVSILPCLGALASLILSTYYFSPSVIPSQQLLIMDSWTLSLWGPLLRYSHIILYLSTLAFLPHDYIRDYLLPLSWKLHEGTGEFCSFLNCIRYVQKPNKKVNKCHPWLISFNFFYFPFIEYPPNRVIFAS